MTDTGYADRSIGAFSGDRTFRRLGHALVWITIISGFFVMFEPAPYDVLMMGAILLFALVGLPLPRHIGPLIVLLFIVISGGFISAVVFSSFADTSKHFLVTAFLSLSSIFAASYVVQNPAANLDRIMKAYCVAATLASIGAIIGYFGLAGSISDVLTLYGGRAKSFFKDPNVLGAYLVAPALFAVHMLLYGKSRTRIWATAVTFLCCVAVFLSFSRGAWGNLVVSGLIYGYLLFVTANNIKERFRLLLIAMVGMCLIIAAGIGALSLKKVSALFEERASLTQNYDTGQFGRFGRQLLGVELVIESPLGIGAKQFEKFFPEAPHNVYLNSFVLSGWAGGLAYFILVIWTLSLGFKQCLMRTPWQGVYCALYASFVGVALEGAIIDTDHWRHFYLLLGLIWGGLLAPGGILGNRVFHTQTA